MGTADARSAVSKHFSRRRHRGRLWWHHQEGSAVCLSVVCLSSVYQLPIIQPSSVVLMEDHGRLLLKGLLMVKTGAI